MMAVSCTDSAYVDAFENGRLAADQPQLGLDCLYLATSNMWEAWQIGYYAGTMGYRIVRIHKSRGSSWVVTHDDCGEQRWTVHEDGRVAESR